MKCAVYSLTALAVVGLTLALEYPPVRRDDRIEDEFYGTKVKDPYRWLEKPNSNEVAAFVDAQNDLTFNYLTECPDRQQIRERLTEVWRYPKYGKPEKQGSRYFYHSQESGKEILYVQDGHGAKPRAILDSEESGVLIFPQLGVSRNGEVLVYREMIKRKNSAPRITGNLRLKNVTDESLLPDLIEDVRHTQIVWTKNSEGFFYFHHRKVTEEADEEDDHPASPILYIYFHRLGTLQNQDVLVFDYTDFHKKPNPQARWTLDMEATDDGRYLMLKTRRYNDREARSPNATFVGDLEKFEKDGFVGKFRLRPIVTSGSPALRYVTNIGNLFYFRSRNGAANYQLIETNIEDKTENRDRVIVAENPNYTLQTASAVGNNLVVLGYTSDSQGAYAELRDLRNGSLIRIFPLRFGELLSFSSKLGDPEIVFRSQTLEGLPTLSSYDTSAEKPQMQPLVELPALTSYNPSDFTSTKITFPTGNGGSEEMVLMHRKDLKMDGSSYLFLVEREFDIDFYFRLYFSYMKDYNAIIAIPNLRQTEGSYKDAALEDYISAAQYLVKNGYTSPSKLISRGTEIFGLFVSAAINRHPELFAAIVPYMVGFDMIRFPTFSNWSVAAAPSDQETFQRFLSVSPLHNIRQPKNESVQYPAVFVPTPDDDYPVIFAFKYIAELQYQLGGSSRQTNPFLIRVVSEPQENLRNYARYHIDREADIRCFLGKSIGLKL